MESPVYLSLPIVFCIRICTVVIDSVLRLYNTDRRIVNDKYTEVELRLHKFKILAIKKNIKTQLDRKDNKLRYVLTTLI